MANPYTQPTLSGYNSSPPVDDGTQVAANEIKWATHINKVGDPLKIFAQNIDTSVLAAFASFFTGSIETVFNDGSNDLNFRVKGNSDDDLFFGDAGNDRIGIGTATPNQKLQVVGTVNASAYQKSGFDIGWTYTAQIATTAGSTVVLADDVDFSAAQELEIIFNGVSQDAVGQSLFVRIGPSSGVVSTGYISAGFDYANTGSGVQTSTSGFFAATAVTAAGLLDGRIRLIRWDPSEHLWMAEGLIHQTGATTETMHSHGSITLAGELADVSITTGVGGGDFDAGEIRIRYR